MDSMSHLRLCAGCNTQWLAWGSREWPPPSYFCPRCTAKQPPFDPQPNPHPTCQVKLRTAPAWQTYYVTERDGEYAVIRRLGWPEFPSQRVHLSALTR